MQQRLGLISNRFTLVLKDLVNGVPTAYGDLESLLTNSEDQIQRSYAHLPPWIQKLVEQLPSKMTKSIGPEVLAAAAEKHGLNSKYANMAGSAASKAGLKIKVPSLKDLVTKPGAVAGMLKAIMNFLKVRFPAFLGMNVLYSLALFSRCPTELYPSSCISIPLRIISLADQIYKSFSLSFGTVTSVVERSDLRKSVNSRKLRLQLLTKMLQRLLPTIDQRPPPRLVRLSGKLRTA